MHSINFQCEVITPLFMYGADGSTPELRPSEFKGMMRFWWRAANCEDDYKKIRLAETRLFGGTNPALKSRVSLRIELLKSYKTIKDTSDRDAYNLKEFYKLKWRFDRKNRILRGDHAGIGYMLYSTVIPKKEKSFIPAGYTFGVKLTGDPQALKQAISSFWLSVYLGGFGTRARRGAGNIVITNVEDTNGILKSLGLNFVPPNSHNEFVKWFKNNLHIAISEIHSYSGVKNLNCRVKVEYSTLYGAKFKFAKSGKESWIDSLNTIGILYQQFRHKNKQDINSAFFGLPIIHSDKSATKARIKYDEGEQEIERRASPLIFKIFKIGNNYHWGILWLGGMFLPDKAEVYHKGKSQKPNDGLVKDFWEGLRDTIELQSLWEV